MEFDEACLKRLRASLSKEVSKVAQASKSSSKWKYSLNVTSGNMKITYPTRGGEITAEVNGYKIARKIAELVATGSLGYLSAKISMSK